MCQNDEKKQEIIGNINSVVVNALNIKKKGDEPKKLLHNILSIYVAFMDMDINRQ